MLPVFFSSTAGLWLRGGAERTPLPAPGPHQWLITGHHAPSSPTFPTSVFLARPAHRRTQAPHCNRTATAPQLHAEAAPAVSRLDVSSSPSAPSSINPPHTHHHNHHHRHHRRRSSSWSGISPSTTPVNAVISHWALRAARSTLPVPSTPTLASELDAAPDSHPLDKRPTGSRRPPPKKKGQQPPSNPTTTTDDDIPRSVSG